MYRDPFILFALSITAHVDLIYIHLANNYCYGYFLHDHNIIYIPTIAPSKSYDAYYNIAERPMNIKIMLIIMCCL